MYSQTIPNDSSGNTGITTPWGMRMCGGMSAVGYVVAKFGSQNPAVYTLAASKRASVHAHEQTYEPTN